MGDELVFFCFFNVTLALKLAIEKRTSGESFMITSNMTFGPQHNRKTTTTAINIFIICGMFKKTNNSFKATRSTCNLS